MNVNLPEDTVTFATILAKAMSAEDSPRGADLASLLDELGVLDLLSEASPDPDNAHLNTVVALEQIARAGQRGPIAQTIWARGQGLTTDRFVAIATEATAAGDRLLPYGAFASTLLTGSLGNLELVPMPKTATAAHTEIDPDHSWLPASVPAPSLDTLDPGFAWRSAAATTVGAMAQATDMAVAHASDRVQFGKPLASFQALQFRMSDCVWRLMGLRLLVREAAWRADRNDDRAEVVSALAWLYAREVGRIITKHTHQIHGAIGFTRELGLTTVTGSVAALRAIHPARPAAAAVRAGRHIPDSADPPSNILGGIRTMETSS